MREDNVLSGRCGYKKRFQEVEIINPLFFFLICFHELYPKRSMSTTHIQFYFHDKVMSTSEPIVYNIRWLSLDMINIWELRIYILILLLPNGMIRLENSLKVEYFQRHSSSLYAKKAAESTNWRFLKWKNYFGNKKTQGEIWFVNDKMLAWNQFLIMRLEMIDHSPLTERET